MAEAAALPDYVLDPNAVMKDSDAAWRYKTAPDYTKTRKLWAEGMLLFEFLLAKCVSCNEVD